MQYLNETATLISISAIALLLGVCQVTTTLGENPPEPQLARGTVFQDTNGNGKPDAGESPLPGVGISNGKQIVKSDAAGHYEIPLPEESVLFVIKPQGFRTALNAQNLPRFYYIHKPDGSPKLQFPGSRPTGPLPPAIDFPLYPQDEPDEFRVILFGDPQPRNEQEVDYITHDVVSELIDNQDSAFGVTLGDIAFDNLATFKPLNRAISLVGIPWYNIIGNHDINLDATQRKHINETFEETYGPSYYSFDYGPVHFIALDNIDWVAKRPNSSKFRCVGGFGDEQLNFVKQDLAAIPDDQMVVLLMHIPIVSVGDREKLFSLIQDRPFCVSISAHTHMHRHLFLGRKDGFLGKKKHHHIINVTVSGSWWGGVKDDRGIPHATMQDGAPNGYSIMTLTDTDYRLDFKAAGGDSSEQMGIHIPNLIKADQLAETRVWVNVYNGSSKSTVEMSLDSSNDWSPMTQRYSLDPNYVRLFKREEARKLFIENELPQPKTSSHLWTSDLPADLKPGTHLMRVRTRDMHGRTYQGQRSFRVKP